MPIGCLSDAYRRLSDAYQMPIVAYQMPIRCLSDAYLILSHIFSNVKHYQNHETAQMGRPPQLMLPWRRLLPLMQLLTVAAAAGQTS
eukprot:gene10514-biopygen7146